MWEKFPENSTMIRHVDVALDRGPIARHAAARGHGPDMP